MSILKYVTTKARTISRMFSAMWHDEDGPAERDNPVPKQCYAPPSTHSITQFLALDFISSYVVPDGHGGLLRTEIRQDRETGQRYHCRFPVPARCFETKDRADAA